MKKTIAFVTGALILALTFSVFALWSCAAGTTPGGTSGGASYTTYAGSDPKGDYIVIDFDTASSLVRRINFTTGETNGWYTYTTLPSSSQFATGFPS